MNSPLLTIDLPDIGPAPDVHMLAAHERERLRGQAIALRRCGQLPVSATLDEFRDAIASAAIEADLAIEIWRRWSLRENVVGERLELGSIRCNARHDLATQICYARSARYQWIMNHEGHA